MEQELTPLKIKTAIKQILKAQNYTYSDLANTLECSLPTAKRVLNQEELSLSRLTKILDWLDVSLRDLEKLMASTEHETLAFNEEQDRFLSKNPMYFSFLTKLRAGESPKAIAKKYELTERSTDRYLTKLEQLELIKVTGTGKVKIPTNSPTAFGPQSQLAKTYFDLVIDNGAQYFKSYIQKEIYRHPAEKDKFENEGAGFTLKAMYVSKHTYNIYQKRLQNTFHEMLDSARSDEKTLPRQELHSSVVLVATSIGNKEDVEFETILNTFGDPKNL